MTLPEGLTLKTFDDLIVWTNTTGTVTEQEAKELSQKITEMVSGTNYKAMLVDNRKLKGIWKPEVDKVWIELMSFLPTKVEKTATLCENVINKLQLNYLSIQAGTVDSVKAFIESEEVELLEFIDLPNLDLNSVD
ncbi:MAG: hypothetical protein WBA54_10890 [Acidaminobacteraceae bacterium]